jgi:hypothetical protein
MTRLSTWTIPCKTCPRLTSRKYANRHNGQCKECIHWRNTFTDKFLKEHLTKTVDSNEDHYRTINELLEDQ